MVSKLPLCRHDYTAQPGSKLHQRLLLCITDSQEQFGQELAELTAQTAAWGYFPQLHTL